MQRPTRQILLALVVIALIAIAVWFLSQLLGGQVSSYNGTVPATQ